MLDFLIVIFCLVLNAFFSAYEMAFVTVSREEIDDLEESEQNIVKRIKYFKKKPERTLSVIQIGISLVGAIAAAVGGTGAVESLEPLILQNTQLSTSMAEALAVTLVIIPLTYFSVVFGELVPKTIALKYPQNVLLYGTTTLGFIDRFMSPVVTFLEVSTNFLLNKMGLGGGIAEDESLGQIVEIGNLPDYHQRFVKNLVSLKGIKVKAAMIPWQKVIALSFSEDDEQVRLKLNNCPHSRIPVLDNETFVGILYKKMLFLKNENIPWQGILKSAITVFEDEKVLDTFLKLQTKQDHMAIVKNRDEKIVGLITIEDIIEEIVGDINDRTDESKTSQLLANRSKINLK